MSSVERLQSLKRRLRESSERRIELKTKIEGLKSRLDDQESELRKLLPVDDELDVLTAAEKRIEELEKKSNEIASEVEAKLQELEERRCR